MSSVLPRRRTHPHPPYPLPHPLLSGRQRHDANQSRLRLLRALVWIPLLLHSFFVLAPAIFNRTWSTAYLLKLLPVVVMSFYCLRRLADAAELGANLKDYPLQVRDPLHGR